MRIYNKGSRIYKFHEFEIAPGFNIVPLEHEQGMEALIAAFPHELEDGGTIPTGQERFGRSIGEKDKEIEELKAKLAALAPVTPVAPEPVKLGRPPGKK